ncbi:MAG TPA: encapsulin-associated ferritin-like protein [Candidatus Omnitrophota bacterium]|nr:encapsulin-associated ferritin-like protein [Candidatus Omnitrophota bacterium]
MAEELHAPYQKLSRKTITMHQAIRSLMEELEAVDWYRQRADDCTDPDLREVLLHNMREEIEHASMVLEWLRRNDADFDGQLRTYLFSKGPITEIEEETDAPGGRSDPSRTTE